MRRIFPHFANNNSIGFFGKRSTFNVFNKLVANLINNIKAPCARTTTKPGAHNAILATNKLTKTAATVLNSRQIANAPPAFVAAIFVKIKPIVIETLGVRSWQPGVIAIRVKVARIAAHVVKHAVEHNRNAVLTRPIAQGNKILIGSKQRVYVHVVGGVVAVV